MYVCVCAGGEASGKKGPAASLDQAKLQAQMQAVEHIDLTKLAVQVSVTHTHTHRHTHAQCECQGPWLVCTTLCLNSQRVQHTDV